MRIQIKIGALGFCALISSCSGPNTVARNVETVATINSVAGVPGAGWIGLVSSAADFVSKHGSPKVGKTSDRLSVLVSKTPSIFWDSSGNYKWAEYSYWREGGELRKVHIDQIPQQMLNYKAAWAKAIGLIPQGVFSDGNADLQKKNTEAFNKGDLVVAEYSGLNGVRIIAVSKAGGPFDLMLIEELVIKP